MTSDQVAVLRGTKTLVSADWLCAALAALAAAGENELVDTLTGG